jgi:hypothetical protein
MQMFILAHQLARQRAADAVRNAPDGYVVRVSEPTRTSAQNALLWSRLHDIADQVEWHGKRLSAEDWKHLFSSSVRRLQVVPNLDGTGFVALGLSTSTMSKRELADLLTLIEAFGTERNVVWSLDDDED